MARILRRDVADLCLLWAAVWVVTRALRDPSELAWLTALWSSLGIATLLALPRLLPARAASAMNYVLILVGLSQIPFMLWQMDQGLPASGWTGGPGSRYAACLLALATPLGGLLFAPFLLVGLAMSQSYLGIAAALAGLVAVLETWRLRLLACAGGLVAVLTFAHWRAWPMWQERLTAWALIWPDWIQHPWIGLGPGSWGSTVPLRQLTGGNMELWSAAHSDLLQWGVEMGVLGLLLLGLWLYLIGPTLWRSPMRGPLVALAVLSLGFHPWHSTVVSPWCLLALAVGLKGASHGKQEGLEQLPSGHVPRHVRPSRLSTRRG